MSMVFRKKFLRLFVFFLGFLFSYNLRSNDSWSVEGVVSLPSSCNWCVGYGNDVKVTLDGKFFATAAVYSRVNLFIYRTDTLALFQTITIEHLSAMFGFEFLANNDILIFTPPSSSSSDKSVIYHYSYGGTSGYKLKQKIPSSNNMDEFDSFYAVSPSGKYFAKCDRYSKYEDWRYWIFIYEYDGSKWFINNSHEEVGGIFAGNIKFSPNEQYFVFGRHDKDDSHDSLIGVYTNEGGLWGSNFTLDMRVLFRDALNFEFSSDGRNLFVGYPLYQSSGIVKWFYNWEYISSDVRGRSRDDNLGKHIEVNNGLNVILVGGEVDGYVTFMGYTGYSLKDLGTIRPPANNVTRYAHFASDFKFSPDKSKLIVGADEDSNELGAIFGYRYVPTQCKDTLNYCLDSKYVPEGQYSPYGKAHFGDGIVWIGNSTVLISGPGDIRESSSRLGAIWKIIFKD